MISRIFLALNAMAIGSIGMFYLYDPNVLLARYGLAAESGGMDNMLRSAYGGVFLAGAEIGCFASIFSVGAPPAAIMPLLYFECIMTVAAIILYLRAQQVQ